MREHCLLRRSVGFVDCEMLMNKVGVFNWLGRYVLKLFQVFLVYVRNPLDEVISFDPQ